MPCPILYSFRSRHSSHHSSTSSNRSRPPSTPYCATCIKERLTIAGLTIQCHRSGCSHTVGVECPGLKTKQTLATPACAHTGVEYLKYGHMMRCEIYPNGGATVIHLEQEQIQHLSKREMDELVDEYFRVCIVKFYNLIPLPYDKTMDNNNINLKIVLCINTLINSSPLGNINKQLDYNI